MATQGRKAIYLRMYGKTAVGQNRVNMQHSSLLILVHSRVFHKADRLFFQVMHTLFPIDLILPLIPSLLLNKDMDTAH